MGTEAAPAASRVRARPHPAVRGLLAHDHVGFTEPARSYRTWLLPPPTSVTLIVNVGESFGGLPAAFVAGLDDRFSVMSVGAAVSCVDVKLTPAGAYRLLGTPARELAGRTVDLGEIAGVDGRRLAAAMREAPDWSRRFALLDDFLGRRAESGPAPRPEVLHVWRRLSRDGGSIGSLAAEVGWSHKHLISRFTDQIGLPPRTFGRVARFNRLLGLLSSPGAPARWAEMAESCGYYDQAHLDRDFRTFAGTTPTEFLGRRAAGGVLVGDGIGPRG